jgi:sugar transferase (PEP-CTERM/EpsH1 system associated)
MQFVDMDSLKWQQYADQTWLPKRWIYRLEAKRLRRYEHQIATTFDHSLVCTPRELHDLRQLAPEAAVSCVANGVDLERFRPMHNDKAPNSLIFTGVMDYYPNVDGVVWFCQEILPLIRQSVPDVTFTICGARPTSQVKALAQHPGVSVTDRVADVRPYLACSSICVVPLRIARGIQNKLLEAMAMGLPTVTTTAAFGDIEATSGADLFVADQPSEFAASVIHLLQDANMREYVGLAARTAMEKTYHWDIQLSKLDEILEAVIAARREAVVSPLVLANQIY